MEDVGFRKCVRGQNCEVWKPGTWRFKIGKTGWWTHDTVRDTVSREDVLIFHGVRTVADAVLLATGWENAMADVLSFSRCKPVALEDAIGRKHPAAKLVAHIREGKP